MDESRSQPLSGAVQEFVVPLFPLADHVLFPGTLQRFHIFEPRYRQMIDDVLDSSGYFAIGAVLKSDRARLAGNPPIAAIGGLAHLEQYTRLEDGRYLLLARGESRVQMSEVASDRLYRRVSVARLDERIQDVDGGAGEAEYRTRLLRCLRAHASEGAELLEMLTVAQLADFLLISLRLPAAELYPIYALPVRERVERVIALDTAKKPS
ncbi:MAG: LON peptidase substrate-binding domain-containing protein [Planctomycetota bacterium]